MPLTDAERQKRYRDRNPNWKTKANGAWKRYANSNKGTTTLLLNYASDRARRNKLDFNLDRDWLRPKIDSGVCELSGIKFERESSEKYKTNPFAPSIDKINPKKGYTKNNCRLILFCINRAKSDWNDDILLKMAKGIIKGITK